MLWRSNLPNPPLFGLINGENHQKNILGLNTNSLAALYDGIKGSGTAGNVFGISVYGCCVLVRLGCAVDVCALTVQVFCNICEVGSFWQVRNIDSSGVPGSVEGRQLLSRQHLIPTVLHLCTPRLHSMI